MSLGTYTALPVLARELMAHHRGDRAARLFRLARRRVHARLRRDVPTMRQLTATRRGIVWREAPVPALEQPSAALVRPVAVASCDADHLAARGEGFPLPLALGHECVADVVEVGTDVRAIQPGERVIVPFQISCGHCPACRDGRSASCLGVPPLSMYGFGIVGGAWGGALADLMLVPFADHMLVPVPSGIDPAAVASVADNVVDGWRHVAPHLAERPGAAVLVIVEGAPSIALYAVQAALALGAGSVHFMSRDQDLLQHAERLGAQPVSDRGRRARRRFPIVVDATGTAAGLRDALHRTERDGHCSSVGPLRASANVRTPTYGMYMHNATLHIGRAHVREGIPEVLDLVRTGALDPRSVTTMHADWSDAAAAFEEHVARRGTKLVVSR
jgi:alcohol dehydrogenase